MNRRTFLFAAAGSLVAVSGAAGAFLSTRTPHRAIAPWQIAAADTADARVFAFRHAILAPNPHNRQPWIVELVGEDRALLWFDQSRRLPETDPEDRQLAIGLGCFLELARMAAADRGVALRIDPFPDGEPAGRLDARPVAAMTFRPDPQIARDPLFAFVATRRSIKEPFDIARPVPPAALAALMATGDATVATGGTVETGAVAALRDLAWRAHEVESLTPRTLKESVDLMRIGKREIEASPDGIDLGGPLLDTLALIGQLSREQIADPSTQAFKQGLDMYRALHATSMGFFWLVTPTATKRESLDTGRVLVRAHLAATRAGLAFHPVSQALQEYAEMAPLRRELHDRLGAGGKVVQMLVRLGYHAGDAAPAPRWPLESRLRTA
jgi:nitroreductase